MRLLICKARSNVIPSSAINLMNIMNASSKLKIKELQMPINLVAPIILSKKNSNFATKDVKMSVAKAMPALILALINLPTQCKAFMMLFTRIGWAIERNTRRQRIEEELSKCLFITYKCPLSLMISGDKNKILYQY